MPAWALANRPQRYRHSVRTADVLFSPRESATTGPSVPPPHLRSPVRLREPDPYRHAHPKGKPGANPTQRIGPGGSCEIPVALYPNPCRTQLTIRPRRYLSNASQRAITPRSYDFGRTTLVGGAARPAVEGHLSPAVRRASRRSRTKAGSMPAVRSAIRSAGCQPASGSALGRLAAGAEV